jgi:hypothetical protein
MVSAARCFRLVTRQGRDLARIESILEYEDIGRPMVLAKAVGLMKKAGDDYPRDKNLLPTLAKVVEALATAKDQESFEQIRSVCGDVIYSGGSAAFDRFDVVVSKTFSEIAEKAQVQDYHSLAAWSAGVAFDQWPKDMKEPEWFAPARAVLLEPVEGYLSNHEIDVIAAALKKFPQYLTDAPDRTSFYVDKVLSLADQAKRGGDPILEFKVLHQSMCLRNQMDPEGAKKTNISDYRELLDLALNRIPPAVMSATAALRVLARHIKDFIDPAENPEVYQEMIEGIARFAEDLPVTEDFPGEDHTLGNLSADCEVLLARAKAGKAPQAVPVPA